MARGEVWNEIITLFRIGGVKVVEARLFVAQDDTKALPEAFAMLVSMRVLGAEIDSDTATNHFPVTNGDVKIPIAVSTFSGNLAGTISHWHGSTAAGTPSTSPAWTDAEHVAFTLSALGKVTIPVSDILALVPGIGGFLRVLLSALPGKQVGFTLGTVNVEIPVHRVSGKVELPPNAVHPAWWQ
jgi:hypothetical protein